MTRVALLFLVCALPWAARVPGETAEVDLREKLLAEGEAALAATRGTEIPQKIPMVDVTYDNGSTGHGFFVQLRSATALVMTTPPLRQVKNVQWQGHDFKLGPLLRKRVSVYEYLWIFQVPASLALPPLPVKNSPSSPMIREEAEMVIATAKGSRAAQLMPRRYKDEEPVLLPGTPDWDPIRINLSPEGFKDAAVGDPVFLKENGELIGVLNEANKPILPGELPWGMLFLLNFQPPAVLPQPALTQVWGVPVGSHPAEDTRFFKEVLPFQMTQDTLGEPMDTILKRHPYLARRSDRHLLDDALKEPLAMEWPFRQRHVVFHKGITTKFEFESTPPGDARDLASFAAEWFSLKFGPPTELLGNGRDHLSSICAVWSAKTAKVVFTFQGSETNGPPLLWLKVCDAAVPLAKLINVRIFKPLTADLPTMRKAFKEVMTLSNYKELPTPLIENPNKTR